MAETKLGVALSGGGFRASFFHLGVLARLAELGLLSRVEVISTVSGGSIVGALYYLHVKKLLESKPDDQITARDYVHCVEAMQTDFLREVQTNIRMRTFVNPWKNLKMMAPWYSRSDRLGELYDELFYRPVAAPGSDQMVQMRSLKIRPRESGGDFRPDEHNAARRAKVPMLLLNATTLNTGHNWRFEAGWMGEPNPAVHGPRQEMVDANTVLAQCDSYDDIVAKQANVELGLAVAASACVPGLFPPLALSSLYPDFRVQLVDGGVHDNQGVKGLIERRCTHFIVSDASGQLADEKEPVTGALPVVMRANDILMDRVREEELAGLLDGSGTRVTLLHLRKGLPTTQLPPLPNQAPGRQSDWRQGALPPQTTSLAFGVHPDVQAALSRLRTDLDTFTDIEAYALMADGYLMACHDVPASLGDMCSTPPAKGEGSWRFLDLRDEMVAPSPRLRKHLAAGEHKFFRVFRLSGWLTAVSALLVAALAYGAWRLFGELINGWLVKEISYRDLLISATLIVVTLALPMLSRAFQALSFLRNPSALAVRALSTIAAALVGGTLIAFHLHTFDRLLVRLGKVSRRSAAAARGQPVPSPSP